MLNELCIRNCPKLIKRLPNRLPSLLKLDISRCPLLEVHLYRFSSLSDLILEECNGNALESVADSTPFSLANLKLRSIRNVCQFPEKLVMRSPAVKVMHIGNISELTTFSLNGSQLSTLEQLELSNCGNLMEFPDDFFNCTSLLDFKIKRCSKLVSLPKLGFSCLLRYLAIEDCEALECLPEGMMNSNSVCNLETLEIIKCSSLKFFSGCELPTSLKLLKIWTCVQLEPLTETMLQNTKSIECLSLRKYPNLKALPDCLHCLSHLTELHISYCDALESFPDRGLPTPNLRRFYVFNCENLKSLPDNMPSLTALQHLGVSSCPQLVSFPKTGMPANLTSIRINNCKNLPNLSEWGLHKFLSLKDLTISGVCQNLLSFGRECLLPAGLTHLHIAKLPNLESLSAGIQHLSSLEVLEITDCPKLYSLPKQGFPSTLCVLEITSCPVLKTKVLKKGKYAAILANVPCVEIDQVLLQ
ncbi:disease resistance protein (TIR-NBS-LRR class) family [Euphorbia peplus]|nr:disease resistance protein (TIR-NBS-LRR class) family [Euphorbia peplus]